MQSGFSLWSFGGAYLELYFDLCFDFLFFNKIYETSLLQEFCVFLTRGNASGFWSLTVLPGGQGFLRRLGAPRDLFEFQVRGCSQGFLCGSFGRA